LERDEEDPVRRTRRQLRCYYDCVSRDTDDDPCPDCIEQRQMDLSDIDDDDDELGLPRY
jgi:hypothetical protein